MEFTKKDIYEEQFNPFKLVGKDWFLLTSGSVDNYNTMTASWGQMGILWNKPVFTAFVRTSRKTFELMEENSLFTASFFDESFRNVLQFCGSHSGRDCDKAKETNLVPISLDGAVSFEQAKTVFVCRKLYANDMPESAFLDKSLLKFYEKDPYHKTFIGEIVSLYMK